MSFWNRPSARDKQVEEILAVAKNYVGYRSRAMRVNIFGSKQGYDGQPWAGSFLETVMNESNTVGLPSLISTTAALAEFVRERRVFRDPKIGDLVFFGFATENIFGQPHVGIVTEVTHWKTHRSFRTIEGEVDAGTPRGSASYDGVFERFRYEADVIFFARPVYRSVSDHTVPRPVLPSSSKVPYVRVPQVQPNRSSSAVEHVQAALSEVLGVYGFSRGKFDQHTQSALATYQRERGLVGGIGLADDTTLRLLASETNERHFRVKQAD